MWGRAAWNLIRTFAGQERQAKELLQIQLLQAAQNLLATGMTLEQVTKLLALLDDQVRQL